MISESGGMETIRNLFIALFVACLISLGIMKLTGTFIFKTEPDVTLINAVVNAEEIHRLCVKKKVNPADVPDLCSDIMQMADKYANNKILVRAVEDACKCATEMLHEPGVNRITTQYESIEGTLELYELASIRLGFKDNEGNLYRLQTGELADWEREEIDTVTVDSISNWFKRRRVKITIIILVVLALAGAAEANTHHIDISW